VANEPENAPIGTELNEDPQLDSLETRIHAARHAEDVRTGRDKPVVDGRSRATQIASTMVGYPLGGIVIGWVLDGIFGTRPWIMLGLMFLAFFGACLQVVRFNKNA
jgi:ATP synthase protein I